MNEQDRKLLENYGTNLEDFSKTLNEIHTVLVGNKEYKIKGLLDRQEADEEFQRKMINDIREFKQNQLNTWDKIEKNHKETWERLDKHFEKIKKQDERISVLEKFQSLINRLSNIKKRTVAVLGTIFTAVFTVFSYWDKVKQFVVDIVGRLGH